MQSGCTVTITVGFGGAPGTEFMVTGVIDETHPVVISFAVTL